VLSQALVSAVKSNCGSAFSDMRIWAGRCRACSGCAAAVVDPSGLRSAIAML